jgi:hypothetical protein
MQKQPQEPKSKRRGKDVAPPRVNTSVHPKTEMPPPKDADDESKQALEGEGSYAGTRRYDEAAQDFARTGPVEESAREAEREVDENPEGMRRAEADAKRGPRH